MLWIEEGRSANSIFIHILRSHEFSDKKIYLKFHKFSVRERNYADKWIKRNLKSRISTEKKVCDIVESTQQIRVEWFGDENVRSTLSLASLHSLAHPHLPHSIEKSCSMLHNEARFRRNFFYSLPPFCVDFALEIDESRQWQAAAAKPAKHSRFLILYPCSWLGECCYHGIKIEGMGGNLLFILHSFGYRRWYIFLLIQHTFNAFMTI